MNDYDKHKILRVLGEASGHAVTDVSHESRHQLTADIVVGKITVQVIARCTAVGLVQVYAMRRWHTVTSATYTFWKLLALDLTQEIAEHAAVARYN